MSTYRERRLAKAERLREWAAKREAKSTAAIEASSAATAGIPFGQPILVGHHSERRHRNAVERGQRQATAAVEHSRKAAEMRAKAENIEAATEGAIYSGEEGAVEALREKLETLEASRARIKAYNASCRKGEPKLELLSEKERAELASTAQVCPYQIGKGGSAPSYWLSNLSGTISRTRKRLAQEEATAKVLEAGGRGPGRVMAARYEGSCAECGCTVERGQQMTYYRLTREVVCESCSSE